MLEHPVSGQEHAHGYDCPKQAPQLGPGLQVGRDHREEQHVGDNIVRGVAVLARYFTPDAGVDR